MADILFVIFWFWLGGAFALFIYEWKILEPLDIRAVLEILFDALFWPIVIWAI